MIECGQTLSPPPPIVESIDRPSRQSTPKLLLAPVSTEKTVGRSRRQSVPKEPLRSQKFPLSESLQGVGLIDSPPVNSASQTVYPYLKPARRDAFKLRVNVKGSDSESRSSSRLSKRRKYSTQPSDAFNILSVDSTTSREHLDNFKAQDLFTFAKAGEAWKNMFAAYEADKSYRNETFGAALNEATHRAHEAEHKLQDVSQEYAESLKAEKEAHMKALEVKEKEVRVAKEKLLLTRLFEMKERLKIYDAFRAHMGSQVEQLKALLVTALDSFERGEYSA